MDIDKIAKNIVAGRAHDRIIDFIVDQSDLSSATRQMDDETAKLAIEVYQHLTVRLKMSNNEKEALNRLSMSVENKYSEDMHRNNIFKAAHALGIKLPSSMF